MQLHPRHTMIAETVETPWGVLVREDHFQYPESDSNLYMVDGNGALLWFAERAIEGDAYSNPVQRISEGLVRCASWRGFDCEIDLKDGKLARAAFTK
jgi:hypothetical protein